MTSWSGTGGAEPRHLFGQSLSCTGQGGTVEEAGIQELLHDYLQPAGGVHVDHGVLAEGPHVHEDGQPAGQRVELLLAHRLGPEVDTGGAGDLDAVQDHVGGPAHGDGDGHRVAQ